MDQVRHTGGRIVRLGVLVTFGVSVLGACVPVGSSLTTPFNSTALTPPAPVTVVWGRMTHPLGSSNAEPSYATTTGVGTSGATDSQRYVAQGFDSKLGYRVVDDVTSNTISITTAAGSPVSTLADPLFPLPSSTPTGYWIYAPRWAPDGTTIAITRLFEILTGGYVANTTVYDGLTGTRLGSTIPGRDVAWRPDVGAVAFADGQLVRTMDLVVGASPVTVETAAPGTCSAPTDWSVTGRLVFFCAVGTIAPTNVLSSMPAAGGPRRILDTGTTGLDAGWLAGLPSTARFVPGTDQIIFDRPSSAISPFNLQLVTGRILEVIADQAGATASPLTSVSPTDIDQVVFTSEDELFGFA